MTSPGNVTVDFKDADIQNVLRILAFKSGVNIVAGKDVTGSVTIRLVDVPWEKALDVILKTYGYAYDRQENVIRVATLENLRKEELSTEVFTLNYSRAADVEKSIKEMVSERGKVRSDPRSNTLIVTDMPTSLQSIRTVIARLDASTPQVLIQAKVVELTLGSADKLGIKWNIAGGLNGSKRPTSFPFIANEQSAINRFLPYGIPPQETIDSTGSLTVTVTDFPSFANNAVAFPLAAKADYAFGTLDFTQFQALLEAINQRSDARILSEPHVTVLNNQEAKILVGEIIAIPTFERNSSTGKMEITGYADRDLGIRLSVLPQINNEKEIVVDVHPEITTLLGYDELTTDIKVPRFTTREAKTQVRIKSGQTVVIGGLIKENTIDTDTKIPILGDIPLFLNVFRHKDKQISKSDILFFMTVNIVDDNVPMPLGHPVSHPAA
jgi:type IV pilus assembly protein PilQ